jgi:hypothetical protein
MFCPSCGLEYTHKTNYCKRCGEELNAAPQSAEIKTQRFHAASFPFFVVAVFCLLGLFLNLLSLHLLLRGHAEEAAVYSFAIGLSLVGVIAGLLIKQLSRLITADQKSNQAPAKERVTTEDAQSPRLSPNLETRNDPVQGMSEQASVVEHTTRRMVGVPVEPEATK